MDSGANKDKRDSRGSSISSSSPAETGSALPGSGPSGVGPSSVLRRRGSLFELVAGRTEPTARSLSGSDNAINTRHRAFDARTKTSTPLPLPVRRPITSGVTIVRPTKEARKAEIVAAVTRRLYTARKKPDPRAEPPPCLSENAEEGDQTEPKELKLCSNARARLQEISKRALALGLHRRLRKDSDTQTEQMTSALRVKEKSVSTDEPTKEVAVETTTTASEANLVVDFGKRVEMAEKSSQWKADSASIGTQSSPLFPPPICYLPPPPPVYGPPFWLNTWWPNSSWGMSCCRHEPKRRANISVDTDETFSDDSLESFCGLSRVGPDGASVDSVAPEPKAALWETLTLRSGKHFKENSSLYQPDVFKTHHPLASIFQKELSTLSREDKSTETDLKREPWIEVDDKPKEVGCNTEPIAVTADEESQTTLCPVHTQEKLRPCSFRCPAFVNTTASSNFQLVCDFTVACHAVQTEPLKLTNTRNTKIDPCCSCDCDPQNCLDNVSLPDDRLTITAAPEVTSDVPSTSGRHGIPTNLPQTLDFQRPKTPFSTPDIIAQARNDCKNELPEPSTRDIADEPACTQNNPIWSETYRPFISLDNVPVPQQPSEDTSRARSLDSIFQPRKSEDTEPPPKDRQSSFFPSSTNEPSRPNSISTKKFRLPCLTENKIPPVTASVTARPLDELSSPTKSAHTQSPIKRITPSSFLSPKGRRLLLTWLNNPGSNPSTGTSMRIARKSFSGRVSRRYVGFREKYHRRVPAPKRMGVAENEKVSVYHNLSLLLSEATNYVKTISQSWPGSSSGQIQLSTQTIHECISPRNVSKQCEVHTRIHTPKSQGISTQTELNKPTADASISTNLAGTADNSDPAMLSTGTQCTLNFCSSFPKRSNTFALFWISQSTQTDVSLWNDTYLLPDNILLETQSMISDEPFHEPVPYFYDLNTPRIPYRPVNIYELLENKTDESRPPDRFDFNNPLINRNHTLFSTDFMRKSRLPCQHSSPRAYLQHLVSLRRGIVEACQSPPARPTGVG